LKKDFEVSESGSKDVVTTTKVSKNKKICKKGLNTDYLKFFKFYYERLKI